MIEGKGSQARPYEFPYTGVSSPHPKPRKLTGFVCGKTAENGSRTVAGSSARITVGLLWECEDEEEEEEEEDITYLLRSLIKLLLLILRPRRKRGGYRHPTLFCFFFFARAQSSQAQRWVWCLLFVLIRHGEEGALLRSFSVSFSSREYTRAKLSGG